MKYRIVCVRDRAAEVFGQPIFVQSTGIGIRSFTDEINRKADNNQLYQHPEDFSLWSLGSFDDETGTFDSNEPQLLQQGSQVSVR